MTKEKGNALFDVPTVAVVSNKLVDRFIVPPFSVFDTKQDYWQVRKRMWSRFGIKSEVGRGDNLTYNQDTLDYEGAQKKHKANSKALTLEGGLCDKLVGKQAYKFTMDSMKHLNDGRGRKNVQGTSIFDPVLCEIMYRWFSNKDDLIIDPFAGGSVRGVVASYLDRNYLGIDLRQEQIDANEENFKEIKEKNPTNYKPTWLCGDSLNIDTLAKDVKADLVFTCPPYYDLEVYSEEEGDISNCETYDDFKGIYFEIIKKACDKLNDNRFACIVVGEFRDKKGAYQNFVGDTITAFKEAGLHYYNEAIIQTAIGTLPIRTPKQFNSGRKFGKNHQNILVFFKGDMKTIKDRYGDVVSDL